MEQGLKIYESREYRDLRNSICQLIRKGTCETAVQRGLELRRKMLEESFEYTEDNKELLRAFCLHLNDAVISSIGRYCKKDDSQTGASEGPANILQQILRSGNRHSVLERTTGETRVRIEVDLDGNGESSVSTGLNFFDHMLSQLPHHSGITLIVNVHGDLEVDEHHTMEDVAITLGEALVKALGDRRGINRYGFVLPMDDCDAMVLMDLGGRVDFKWDVPFTREYVGDTPTEMFKHFFHSLCCAMKCNLHIQARGENNHHLAESVFKAFARTLGMAVRREPFKYDIPSSKGLL